MSDWKALADDMKAASTELSYGDSDDISRKGIWLRDNFESIYTALNRLSIMEKEQANLVSGSLLIDPEELDALMEAAADRDIAGEGKELLSLYTKLTERKSGG